MEMLFSLVLRVGYSGSLWLCQEELRKCRCVMCNGVVERLEVSKQCPEVSLGILAMLWLMFLEYQLYPICGEMSIFPSVVSV